MQPLPEFQKLREPLKTFPRMTLDKTTVLEGVSTDCAEFEAVFSGTGTFGFEARRSSEGTPGIVISIENSFRGAFVNVGSARSYVGKADRYDLRVFLDKLCVEVFVNDGATALYKYFEPQRGDLSVAVFGQTASVPVFLRDRMPAPSGPVMESLIVWPMRAVEFSLEHFHA